MNSILELEVEEDSNCWSRTTLLHEEIVLASDSDYSESFDSSVIAESCDELDNQGTPLAKSNKLLENRSDFSCSSFANRTMNKDRKAKVNISKRIGSSLNDSIAQTTTKYKSNYLHPEGILTANLCSVSKNKSNSKFLAKELDLYDNALITDAPESILLDKSEEQSSQLIDSDGIRDSQDEVCNTNTFDVSCAKFSQESILEEQQCGDKENFQSSLCSNSFLKRNSEIVQKRIVKHLHEETIDLYTPETVCVSDENKRLEQSPIPRIASKGVSSAMQFSSNTTDKFNVSTDSEDEVFLEEHDLSATEGIIRINLNKTVGIVNDSSNTEGSDYSSGAEDNFCSERENEKSMVTNKISLDRDIILAQSANNSQANSKACRRKEYQQTPKHYSSSESDSDDQFEHFLTKMKSMTASKNSKSIHNSCDDKYFINDDSIESDDEGFHRTMNRRFYSTETKLVREKIPNVSVKSALSSSFQNKDTPHKVLFDVTNLVNSPDALIFSTPEGDEESNFVTPKKLNLSDSDGNDMFSDKKNVQSLIKDNNRKGSNVEKEKKAEFLYSLSLDTQSGSVCEEAKPFLKQFKKKKEALVTILYSIFNEYVFNNELSKTMEITWKPRLTKTAGLCQCVRSMVTTTGRNARIQLSSKVIDSAARLRDTLLHEMCHAATWIIYGYQDGHGKLWKFWAQEAIRAFPNLPRPTVCHNYVIKTRYTYKCVLCGSCVGRHSKSLDTTSKRCGRCGGKFELINNNASTSKTPRTPSRFALFVKENYGSVKKSNQKSKHGEIMRILSADFSSKAKIQ